jgi:hypothetical protein
MNALLAQRILEALNPKQRCMAKRQATPCAVSLSSKAFAQAIYLVS